MQQRGGRTHKDIAKFDTEQETQSPHCACEQLAEKCSFNQLNTDLSFTNVLPNKDYSS